MITFPQKQKLASAIFFHSRSTTDRNTFATMTQPFHNLEQSIPKLKGLGLIPALVSRTGRPNGHQTIIMSLETGPNATHPVLIATRETRTAINMFQNRAWVIQDPTGRDLGVLSNPREGHFLLKHTSNGNELAEVLAVHYHRHSIPRVLTENPPRQARVSVLGVADLASREAQRKGSRFSLNSHGRGSFTSRKNMQLENENGNLVLQFVKWDDSQFHLDYA
jgi:hypothetical protein